jgi:hypothetical protein
MSRCLSGVVALALIAGVSGTAMSARAQTLPADAAPLCAVPSTTFNGWFQSGSPALNGMVMPANSVGFSNPANASGANCAFYQWAEQMFMWVTSQVPSSPGSGYGAFLPASGTPPSIFDSTAFFDVSPPGVMGIRTLVPHPTTFRIVRDALPRGRKPGPGNLPLITAKGGRVLELEPLRLGPTGKALIADARGRPVEIARVRVNRNRRATLFDGRGRVIALRGEPSRTSPAMGHFPRVMAIASICRAVVVCNGGGIAGSVVDVATGSVIEVETGQAPDTPTNPVVMAQNGSLIYYSIMVNDVYAYFNAAANSGATAMSTFPTTQPELTQIVNFAKSQGASFPDANALTIELKGSWIDASRLPASAVASYITTQASIPDYPYPPPANGAQWKPGPNNKPATLALVGMHVVGSVKGHPEMIFATFEHVGNAPNAQYSYLANLIPGFPLAKTVPQDTGSWLLSNGSAGMFNIENMDIATGVLGAIEAIAPNSISPSNTIRWKPWGSASLTTPNPNVASVAASNTEIISLNNSVRGMMSAAGAASDVRNNYIMIGATWTQSGAPPGLSTGESPMQYGPTYPVNVVGTSRLFNSTMETYDQGSDSTLLGHSPGNVDPVGDNCFDCHGSNNKGSLAIYQPGLSHIFYAITATSVPK